MDLARNNISYLDVGLLPALQYLNLDNNVIFHVTGTQNLKHLRHLSWREQRCHNTIQYRACQEVHHLYISSSPIQSLTHTAPFLNLQTLELASVGLQALPADFGMRCLNLRILNLNYNAVVDMSPMVGIAKLQRFYLVGNRISRLRRTVAVLERLGPTLLEVDLRDNPLSVGFYIPFHQRASSEKQIILPTRRNCVTAWEDDMATTGMKYLLPPLDREADAASRDRLDEETKLRRRVYEMLVLHACKKLQRLDGLDVDRREAGRQDGVWERLVELGVLRHKGKVSGDGV